MAALRGVCRSHTKRGVLWPASHVCRQFSVSSAQRADKAYIGFIGLGNMGTNMAKNLLTRGHKLVVYDVYPEAMARMRDTGAIMADSPSDVASQVDRIVTMLPASYHVTEVYMGKEGILQGVKTGTLLIDSSTIDPTVSQTMSKAAAKLGATFLDAPVSGGVNAAKGGSLTFMVGGNSQAFVAAEELLKCMGKNIIHCGDVGTGQAAKICNNMMLAISMIGTSETMNLGIRLGLDPKLLTNILNSSSGRCWSSEVYNPVPGVMDNVPASNNYEGGFGTSLMAKDLGLAQNAATATSTPTPLGSLAHQLYRLMIQKGYSNKDFSAVFQFLQEQGNTK